MKYGKIILTTFVFNTKTIIKVLLSEKYLFYQLIKQIVLKMIIRNQVCSHTAVLKETGWFFLTNYIFKRKLKYFHHLNVIIKKDEKKDEGGIIE